jgi:hypothetical protein
VEKRGKENQESNCAAFFLPSTVGLQIKIHILFVVLLLIRSAIEKKKRMLWRVNLNTVYAAI